MINSTFPLTYFKFYQPYRLFFLRSIAQFFTRIYMNRFVSSYFISWTNWVNSSKFMDNCRISCQVMADLAIFSYDLIFINLYWISFFYFHEPFYQIIVHFTDSSTKPCSPCRFYHRFTYFLVPWRVKQTVSVNC